MNDGPNVESRLPSPAAPSTAVDAPVVTDVIDGSSLDRIAALHQEVRRLNHQLEVAIHAAVEAGQSWAAIARVLGVTAQAAHKRYRWIRYSAVTDQVWREPPLPG